MTTTSSFRAEFVEYIPSRLDEGVLYISNVYGTMAHKCACGCGSEISVPIGPPDWDVTVRDGKVSVWPSIGNWSYPCQSHYVISNGNVRWAGTWSKERIDAGRAYDQQKKDAYFAERAREAKPLSLWSRLKIWLFG